MSCFHCSPVQKKKRHSPKKMNNTFYINFFLSLVVVRQVSKNVHPTSYPEQFFVVLLQQKDALVDVHHMLIILRISICCMVMIKACHLLNTLGIVVQIGITHISLYFLLLFFSSLFLFSKQKDEISSFLENSTQHLLYFPSQ